MKKTNLINNLSKFGYSYIIDDNIVLVKVGFGLYLTVSFVDDNVRIKEEFKGYNFLSGFINMGIKGQLIYNSIMLLLFSIVVCYFMYTTPDLIPFLSILYVMFSVLFIVWMIFYIISAESIKRQIISWISVFDKAN